MNAKELLNFKFDSEKVDVICGLTEDQVKAVIVLEEMKATQEDILKNLNLDTMEEEMRLQLEIQIKIQSFTNEDDNPPTIEEIVSSIRKEAQETLVRVEKEIEEQAYLTKEIRELQVFLKEEDTIKNKLEANLLTPGVVSSVERLKDVHTSFQQYIKDDAEQIKEKIEFVSSLYGDTKKAFNSFLDVMKEKNPEKFAEFTDIEARLESLKEEEEKIEERLEEVKQEHDIVTEVYDIIMETKKAFSI